MNNKNFYEFKSIEDVGTNFIKAYIINEQYNNKYFQDKYTDVLTPFSDKIVDKLYKSVIEDNETVYIDYSNLSVSEKIIAQCIKEAFRQEYNNKIYRVPFLLSKTDIFNSSLNTLDSLLQNIHSSCTKLLKEKNILLNKENILKYLLSNSILDEINLQLVYKNNTLSIKGTNVFDKLQYIKEKDFLNISNKLNSNKKLNEFKNREDKIEYLKEFSLNNLSQENNSYLDELHSIIKSQALLKSKTNKTYNLNNQLKSIYNKIENKLGVLSNNLYNINLKYIPDTLGLDIAKRKQIIKNIKDNGILELSDLSKVKRINLDNLNESNMPKLIQNNKLTYQEWFNNTVLYIDNNNELMQNYANDYTAYYTGFNFLGGRETLKDDMLYRYNDILTNPSNYIESENYAFSLDELINGTIELKRDNTSEIYPLERFDSYNENYDGILNKLKFYTDNTSDNRYYEAYTNMIKRLNTSKIQFYTDSEKEHIEKKVILEEIKNLQNSNESSKLLKKAIISANKDTINSSSNYEIQKTIDAISNKRIKFDDKKYLLDYIFDTFDYLSNKNLKYIDSTNKKSIKEQIYNAVRCKVPETELNMLFGEYINNVPKVYEHSIFGSLNERASKSLITEIYKFIYHNSKKDYYGEYIFKDNTIKTFKSNNTIWKTYDKLPKVDRFLIDKKNNPLSVKNIIYKLIEGTINSDGSSIKLIDNNMMYSNSNQYITESMINQFEALISDNTDITKYDLYQIFDCNNKVIENDIINVNKLSLFGIDDGYYIACKEAEKEYKHPLYDKFHCATKGRNSKSLLTKDDLIKYIEDSNIIDFNTKQNIISQLDLNNVKSINKSANDILRTLSKHVDNNLFNKIKDKFKITKNKKNIFNRFLKSINASPQKIIQSYKEALSEDEASLLENNITKKINNSLNNIYISKLKNYHDYKLKIDNEKYYLGNIINENKINTDKFKDNKINTQSIKNNTNYLNENSKVVYNNSNNILHTKVYRNKNSTLIINNSKIKSVPLSLQTSKSTKSLPAISISDIIYNIYHISNQAKDYKNSYSKPLLKIFDFKTLYPPHEINKSILFPMEFSVGDYNLSYSNNKFNIVQKEKSKSFFTYDINGIGLKYLKNIKQKNYLINDKIDIEILNYLKNYAKYANNLSDNSTYTNLINMTPKDINKLFNTKDNNQYLSYIENLYSDACDVASYLHNPLETSNKIIQANIPKERILNFTDFIDNIKQELKPQNSNIKYLTDKYNSSKRYYLKSETDKLNLDIKDTFNDVGNNLIDISELIETLVPASQIQNYIVNETDIPFNILENSAKLFTDILNFDLGGISLYDYNFGQIQTIDKGTLFIDNNTENNIYYINTINDSNLKNIEVESNKINKDLNIEKKYIKNFNDKDSILQYFNSNLKIIGKLELDKNNLPLKSQYNKNIVHKAEEEFKINSDIKNTLLPIKYNGYDAFTLLLQQHSDKSSYLNNINIIKNYSKKRLNYIQQQLDTTDLNCIKNSDDELSILPLNNLFKINNSKYIGLQIQKNINNDTKNVILNWAFDKDSYGNFDFSRLNQEVQLLSQYLKKSQALYSSNTIDKKLYHNLNTKILDSIYSLRLNSKDTNKKINKFMEFNILNNTTQSPVVIDLSNENIIEHQMNKVLNNYNKYITNNNNFETRFDLLEEMINQIVSLPIQLPEDTKNIKGFNYIYNTIKDCLITNEDKNNLSLTNPIKQYLYKVLSVNRDIISDYMPSFAIDYNKKLSEENINKLKLNLNDLYENTIKSLNPDISQQNLIKGKVNLLVNNIDTIEQMFKSRSNIDNITSGYVPFFNTVGNIKYNNIIKGIYNHKQKIEDRKQPVYKINDFIKSSKNNINYLLPKEITDRVNNLFIPKINNDYMIDELKNALGKKVINKNMIDDDLEKLSSIKYKYPELQDLFSYYLLGDNKRKLLTNNNIADINNEIINKAISIKNAYNNQVYKNVDENNYYYKNLQDRIITNNKSLKSNTTLNTDDINKAIEQNYNYSLNKIYGDIVPLDTDISTNAESLRAMKELGWVDEQYKSIFNQNKSTTKLGNIKLLGKYNVPNSKYKLRGQKLNTLPYNHLIDIQKYANKYDKPIIDFYIKAKTKNILNRNLPDIKNINNLSNFVDIFDSDIEATHYSNFSDIPNQLKQKLKYISLSKLQSTLKPNIEFINGRTKDILGELQTNRVLKTFEDIKNQTIFCNTLKDGKVPTLGVGMLTIAGQLFKNSKTIAQNQTPESRPQPDDAPQIDGIYQQKYSEIEENINSEKVVRLEENGRGMNINIKARTKAVNSKNNLNVILQTAFEGRNSSINITHTDNRSTIDADYISKLFANALNS